MVLAAKLFLHVHLAPTVLAVIAGSNLAEGNLHDLLLLRQFAGLMFPCEFVGRAGWSYPIDYSGWHFLFPNFFHGDGMGSGECFAGRHQFAHVLQMLFGVVLAVSTDCSCLLLRELQEADAFDCGLHHLLA